MQRTYYPLHCIPAVCTPQPRHCCPKSYHKLYPTLLCSTVPHDHYHQIYHQPIALLLQCILSEEIVLKIITATIRFLNYMTNVTGYLAGNRPLLLPPNDNSCGYQSHCESNHQGLSHPLCSPHHPKRWARSQGQNWAQFQGQICLTVWLLLHLQANKANIS